MTSIESLQAQTATTFDQMFPQFVESCVRLHAQFIPVAFVILVLWFEFFFWSGPPHPVEQLKFLVMITAVLTRFSSVKAGEKVRSGVPFWKPD